MVSRRGTDGLNVPGTVTDDYDISLRTGISYDASERGAREASALWAVRLAGSDSNESIETNGGSAPKISHED